MAKITGATGSITIPDAAGGQDHLVTAWRGNLTREVHEATTFDDTGNARRKIGGPYHMTGSCDAWLDDTDPPLIGTMDDVDAQATTGFILKATDSRTYAFDGIITDIAPAVEKVGQARVTITFESSGDVVIV